MWCNVPRLSYLRARRDKGGSIIMLTKTRRQGRHRSRDKIEVDTLRYIEQGETVTHRLMYEVEITHFMITEILKTLSSNGFINYNHNGKPYITNKGKRYLYLREKEFGILGSKIVGDNDE